MAPVSTGHARAHDELVKSPLPERERVTFETLSAVSPASTSSQPALRASGSTGCPNCPATSAPAWPQGRRRGGVVGLLMVGAGALLVGVIGNSACRRFPFLLAPWSTTPPGALLPRRLRRRVPRVLLTPFALITLDFILPSSAAPRLRLSYPTPPRDSLGPSRCHGAHALLHGGIFDRARPSGRGVPRGPAAPRAVPDWAPPAECAAIGSKLAAGQPSLKSHSRRRAWPCRATTSPARAREMQCAAPPSVPSGA